MEPIPTYLRERMVQAVQRGEKAAAVARRFEVSPTAVRNFVRLAKEGALEPKPHSGGPQPTLDDDARKRLLAAVDRQPDATLEELVETCGLEVSISTVSRELAKLDRPRKRKVPRAREQSEQRIKKQRRQWHQKTRGIDAKRLVFLDEMGIATNMTRRYGRAPANERVYTDVAYRNYKSLTVLGAMRLGGSTDFPMMVYEGGTSTDRMVEYVTGPLKEVLHPDDIVMADRLASHTSHRVADALAEQDAEIQLLPPYSPDLNPIERMWSKLKTGLRAVKAKTVDQLRAALDQVLTTISDADIRHWIAHSNYLATE
jgi:transposase